VSGRIQALYVGYNSIVKKGQLIAQIDPSNFATQVTQARAGLESARADEKNAIASMENSKAEIANVQASILSAKANQNKTKAVMGNLLVTLNRFKQLRQKDLVSQSEVDDAQLNYDSAVASDEAAKAQVIAANAQLDSAKAKVRSAEAQVVSAHASISKSQAVLDQAQLNVDYTRIIAPCNGTVISKSVEVGQTVAASLQAPTLFLIAEDLSKMQAVASIDEADVGLVKENQKATFTVDAYPQKTFKGMVSQIRFQPITSANVITYQGIIEVSNPDLELKPGMTANISFIVAEKTDVIKVPNNALRFKLDTTANISSSTTANGNRRSRGGNKSSGDKQNRGRVYVLDAEKKAKPVEVTLGVTDSSFTEVINPTLKEGDPVITGYVLQSAGSAAPSSSASRIFTGGRPH
jgi:HlyD family secretion protein